jgi:hypothetical protein
MRKRITVLLAIVALLALVAAPAAASNGEGDIPTFDAWLQAASGPLVSVIAGMLISWPVGLWPAYNDWETKYKRLVYGGICITVPVGAACLRASLGYVAWSFDPLIWHALWHDIAAALAGTVDYHARKLQIAKSRQG